MNLLEVFERSRVAHKGRAEPALGFLSDDERRVHRQAKTAGDFENTTGGVVEKDPMFGTAALYPTQVVLARKEVSGTAGPGEEGVSFAVASLDQFARASRRTPQ